VIRAIFLAERHPTDLCPTVRNGDDQTILPDFGTGFGLVGVVRAVSIGRFMVSGARDQGVL
jgi:hypothetical protein